MPTKVFLTFSLTFFIHLIGFKSLGASSVFVSGTDKDLSFKNIVLCPWTDNVSDIYAKPVQTTIEDKLSNSKKWEVKNCSMQGKKITLDSIEDSPKVAVDILKKSGAEIMLTGRISKGPAGIGLRMVLFSLPDGHPIAVENISNFGKFELKEIVEQSVSQFEKIENSIPYEAMIISRKGLQVTVNRGKNQGFIEGQKLIVVQITKLIRHPKHHFLVNVEKQIMGTIQLQKVDEQLSFGSIITEREPNLISSGFKLNTDKFVNYPVPLLAPVDPVNSTIHLRPDSQISLGESPQEWKPPPKASFGSLAIIMGLGSYSISNNLNAGAAGEPAATGLSSNQTAAPSIHLKGEAWITSAWIANLELHESVAKIGNDYPTSSPSSLSLQTSEMFLSAGYRFWMDEIAESSEFNISLGLNSMKSYIDDSSPTAFTSVSYGGTYIGFGGSVPFTTFKKSTYRIGGKYYYSITSSLAESPKTSGNSSSDRISIFSVFGEFPWRPNIKIYTEVRFASYGSTLSGAGSRAVTASSVSQAATSFCGGVQFLW